ncbi:hypothetical protein AGABI1DRAFT_135277 [Agaricus bisporus var. burnettii JB137-S8]|uniref:MULE transposase domain-containing protein n=1 Tax=Agaricus bisporus var. burnettii (strain JB137-S8 / ATCC MYA-4627 / FGSC 10392) TaxID=597362 RepID=K5XFT2_AGABU|nr:uncharacterized protein AGABI1DRAFT_135277 [Agaricus bisporus var. burnettii JB137-S8]EKM73235.1 hypothetical protein AGABI1DRAFT_135277 [Agaricus bisporus var. burnettii JB137-S8]
MLPANICSIDHSHKITKHIARVDGEQVFTGLLTVTNDLGQIRTCNLVATKSHSQFESALFQMRRSLDTYGHDQPQIFYTDNISDRLFLENSFPSLRNNVVAIDKYADLDPFEVSITGMTIFPKDTSQSINDAISTILDDIPVQWATKPFQCFVPFK